MPTKKRKVTAKDVPGTGAAAKAAKAVQKRKKTQKSKLDSIMSGIKKRR
jgi:hypothetical protein